MTSFTPLFSFQSAFIFGAHKPKKLVAKAAGFFGCLPQVILSAVLEMQPRPVMRHFTAQYLSLLIAFAWSAAWPCHAAPTVKTAPHTFPMQYVGFYKDTPIIPAIALKANFVAYPDSPSYKQFLDAPEDSPERVVANYVQTLSDEREALLPETLATAENFYTEDEKKDNDEAIIQSIKGLHKQINKIADIRMWHRYDAGLISIISLAYISPSRVQPFRTLYLRKSGASYFITGLQSGSNKYKDGQSIVDGIALSNVVTLNESNLVSRPDLANVPQPDYRYSFALRNSLPEDISSVNQLKVLFTGKPSNILVDENMVPADPVQALIKRAVQVRRKGTLQEFLSLWTDYDRNGTFARNMALQNGRNAPYAPASSIGFFAGQDKVRIVFTMDFEVGALVFLRNNKSKKLHLLKVWKQAPNDYRLSESGSLERGDVLPGNLNTLFDSSNFQSYVNDQIDQFIEQNDTKAANPVRD